MNKDSASPGRICKYDTIRFFLIFLVITAHCMEQFSGGKVSYLYKIIYSFHMPAFIYLTGKFARFDRAKIMKHLVLPYFVFDTLYLLFATFVLEKTPAFQYTTPYWIMWYLMVMVFYYVLIPMLPEKGSGRAFPLLAVSVAIALLAGFMDTLGYYMSLSRFFVFFPFFLGGYYHEEFSGRFREIRGSRLILSALSILLILAAEFYIIYTKVPKAALYGSYDYVSAKSNILDRVVILAAAAAWILVLETFTPERRIPVISALGQNTMPVFLLHGFVLRYAGKIELFRFSQVRNLLLAICLAALLTAAFGNRYVGRLFRKLF